ncbi:MAG: radical SAM protein [Candidatus Latescibacterota bacterium]|nr:MAG: radical SAM protein [Candidatus Latescibacterota bacterium]
MTLPLKTSVLYGPVNSRRYGRSLGINLSPCRYKECSFNCVYCHYGLTDKITLNTNGHDDGYTECADVIEQLQDTLESPLEIDLITFSGNGEPTLHPDFPKMVDAVVELRDRYRPGAKTALLSNSTGLYREEVRRSVAEIDLPVFKLDAGTERTFMRINRPAKGVSFESIVEHLANLDGIYVQTVCIDGEPSNTHPDEMIAYYERLQTIQPRGVHLYSTDRPVPSSSISRVDPEWLEDIASQITSETGVPAAAYSNGKKRLGA